MPNMTSSSCNTKRRAAVIGKVRRSQRTASRTDIQAFHVRRSSRRSTMEVLTSFPHHQLRTNLNTDVAPLNLFGVESSKACGNEISLKQQASFSREDVTTNARQSITEHCDVSEDILGGSQSQDKEEKDSDAVEGSINYSVSKSSKKSKDQAQIDYLLSNLPAVNRLFKVHEKIGEGTFSSVFLASLRGVSPGSPLSNRHFAVKHLIPTTHPSRAERELKCLQDIGGSDNVVGVHLCMRNQDNIAFIMPYLPHKRFHEYVMEMGVSETRNYMKHLLLALRRVHSFNIIHRDVKPSNFLYDRGTKQFLLVDFGLSQPVEETSKICSVSTVKSDESRKRKREKELLEEPKKGAYEVNENSAKRIALALNNSTNIIKTPEKLHQVSTDFDNSLKSIPQLVSSRAKRLQNITNKTAAVINGQRTSNTTIGGVIGLNSPVKDVDMSLGKKTPRKNKIYNTENISPLKYENQVNNMRSFHFEVNEIWRDKIQLGSEKQALDLRKNKIDVDVNHTVSLSQSSSKSTLQRKILFDDLPDENFKMVDQFSSRLPIISPTNQLLPKHLAGQALNSPMGKATSSRVGLNSSFSLATGSCDSLCDSNGGFGKEFRTLAPDYTKDDVSGSSIVRVQNSQVKSQQMSPVTPREKQNLTIPPYQQLPEKTTNRDTKIIFAKPQAPIASGSLHRSNTPSSPHCNCTGRPQVCTICLSRKAYNAPRAGTPGFRPPEVLLRSPFQTTAVDMWAVGVILLCILSGCYPFFRSPDDLTALAEIMTVFGTDKIKETAKRLGRMVVCSQPSLPLDLKKLCTRMRQRRKDKNLTGSASSNLLGDRCQNCCQPLGKPDSCICLKDLRDSLLVNPMEINNCEESDDVFPDTAYHLLARLLDLDADSRITATQALNHPFVTG